jgi:O-antigen ligase
LIERRLALAAFGSAMVIACITSILISRSRGALLALLAGSALGAAAASRRRMLRTSLVVCGLLLVVVGLVTIYVGASRTSIGRLVPSSSDLLGRRVGLEIALSILRRFPLFGSGLGTFIDLAPMKQPPGFDTLFNHAHDDYAEIAATTGAVGFLVFVIPLACGLRLFIRRFAAGETAMSWRRRAFYAAAFASIATALAHAFIDFNFFIPANAVTLAAIAGAAVATRSESVAIPDSAFADSRV